MNYIPFKRELMISGAYLIDSDNYYGIRDRISGDDFITEILANVIGEVEGHKRGEINREDLRHLPFLMDSLRCPNGGKAIDGIEEAVKEYSRAKRLYKTCLMSSWATKNEDVESIKEKVRVI